MLGLAQIAIQGFDSPRHLTLANYPIRESRPLLEPPTEGLVAILEPTDSGVRLTLRTGVKGRYVKNSLGAILGSLEAKEGKKWRPIEMHRWNWCGSATFALKLQPSREWSYEVTLPTGDKVTPIRWRTHDYSPSGGVLSNEIEWRLPKSRFELSPAAKREYFVDGDVIKPRVKTTRVSRLNLSDLQLRP